MSEESNAESSAKQLLGAAGVHYATAELLRRGYLALPTTRNMKGTDIVVQDRQNLKTVNIQVKTTYDKRKELNWILNSADERVDSNKLYVLVNLRGLEPDYYIVSSSVLGPYLQRTHQKWLRAPGRQGRAHRENRMRKFPNRYERIDLNEFHAKWNTVFK
jgi:acyl-ACP thioesterase